MAEELKIVANSSREEKYRSLEKQLEALLEGEDDWLANLSNFSAAIKQTFNFLWVGFFLQKADELVLGPFQGPIACSRIGIGKGVCGKAFQEQEVIIVPDVDQFPGHIACSSESRSEIVLPFKTKEVQGVLDIDSQNLDDFSETDAFYLNRMLKFLESD